MLFPFWFRSPTNKIRNISLVAFFIVITPFVVAPFSASGADEEALTFDTLGTGSDYYQGSYSLGWRFKAKSDLRVTALGFYDDLRNGLAASHEVGIYDVLTCELLASTTVRPTDPLEGTGFFRYRSITPVTLTSGKDYYVAALTNGGDDYAIAVSTMTPNTAIDYWGFAIFGNTQTTTTLKCPNGSAAQQGFKGDYGPNFKFGDSTGGGDTPTPTPTPSNGKRPTKITLFCNRKGVLLEQASCSATVADASTSYPRITPTGTIDFVSTNGFTPASSSCFPVKPDHSPDGIASCTAEFQVPNGFPVGGKFPIDATYNGDSNFNPSSTSHTLIQAGCIGDSNNPCSGAVALSFSDNGLQVLKAVLKAVIGCGTTAALRAPASTRFETEAVGLTLGCNISLNTSGELANMLHQLGFTQDLASQFGAAISNADANSDATLKGLKDLFKKAGSNSTFFDQINASPEALNAELIKYIRRAQQQQQRSSKVVEPETIGSRVLAAKKMKVVSFGSAAAKIKANTEKTVNIRLNNFGKRFTKALKKSGINSISINFNLKSTRIGAVPDGVEKKVSATESLDITF